RGPTDPVVAGPAFGREGNRNSSVPSLPQVPAVSSANARPWFVSIGCEAVTLAPGDAWTTRRAPGAASNTFTRLTSQGMSGTGSLPADSYASRRPSTGAKRRGAPSGGRAAPKKNHTPG